MPTSWIPEAVTALRAGRPNADDDTTLRQHFLATGKPWRHVVPSLVQTRPEVRSTLGHDALGALLRSEAFLDDLPAAPDWVTLREHVLPDPPKRGSR
jgi:hypothetical protein